MIQVPLYEVKNDLSRYLRIAEKEDVIITRHGVPAGILIGFGEPEDWWEEALLRHPQFKERIAHARQSARAGKGITIEQLSAELNIEPPTLSDEVED
ncbi:MAG: type II toxin-antitoxin system Phd/YefM family antitoxin [Caldilineaceae bacterium]